ncbi:pyridoxamine 5'-phosphate oxidase family protein [Enterococcus sp. BWM-S5]|uniref:Pyridoxamine 5'-phosphate oxidase family protein n=1 Tax=Enterococcus larvae TaxID=2794352 RepID=A0ABS4CIB1_9ENTE|nr:pyridoxamine 5'-phosphate oxidase family protein [Enterococcus larvae]
MIEEIRKLIENSRSFLLSTVDRNGFPNTIVVSKPIARIDFHTLKFYVDGNGSTVKNIKQSSKGNVICYNEEKHQSLLLKGMFSVHEIEGYKIIEDRLNDYQKFLDHKNPVILSFDVYTAKVHDNGTNEFEQFEKL